jgi:hypothetical protein
MMDSKLGTGIHRFVKPMKATKRGRPNSLHANNKKEKKETRFVKYLLTILWNRLLEKLAAFKLREKFSN